MTKQAVRCRWVNENNPLYIAYHDREWGVPVYDDKVHFEFLVLEGAQAGLSWETILKRRETYRKAFDQFDVRKIANYTQAKVDELLQDPGIIRNRLKVASCIINAQKFIEIQREFGSFNAYVWQFVEGKPLQNHRKSIQEVPVETKEAQALSANLKKRGFTFVGPTIMYAYMQAVGLVNDHTVDCFCYKERCLH
ncbi:MAG: tag [Chlamydiia bacterium]|nr:tag [Chlamydiia bacterium]